MANRVLVTLAVSEAGIGGIFFGYSSVDRGKRPFLAVVKAGASDQSGRKTPFDYMASCA
jgi:hypothetical protein